MQKRCRIAGLAAEPQASNVQKASQRQVAVSDCGKMAIAREVTSCAGEGGNPAVELGADTAFMNSSAEVVFRWRAVGAAGGFVAGIGSPVMPEARPTFAGERTYRLHPAGVPLWNAGRNHPTASLVA